MWFLEKKSVLPLLGTLLEMIPSSSIDAHGEAHHVGVDTTNKADHKAEPGLRKSRICKRDEIKGN